MDCASWTVDGNGISANKKMTAALTKFPTPKDKTCQATGHLCRPEGHPDRAAEVSVEEGAGMVLG
jgi:hypothetical protein